MKIVCLVVALMILPSCSGYSTSPTREEITFHSGSFKIVGDLIIPDGNGPFPVVLFVHGDGPNNRTSAGGYLPIMQRMRRAGFATFAWDKPGTGASVGQIDRTRLEEQRTQIVLDAIEVMKAHSDIDSKRIGLWGISQAGYVMPRVLSNSEDVAFMIAVSCPGVAGVEQGAYLVSAQAVCAGVSLEVADRMRRILCDIERAATYDEYVDCKNQLDSMPGIEAASIFGYRKGPRPRDEWHAPNPQGAYFWNPIEIIEKTTIPVLAVFGERDTQIDPIQGAQAYREALARAGNRHFLVELIPGTDHSIILSKTGCLDERKRRTRGEWTNYAPQYLDVLEDWMKTLPDRTN